MYGYADRGVSVNALKQVQALSVPSYHGIKNISLDACLTLACLFCDIYSILKVHIFEHKMVLRRSPIRVDVPDAAAGNAGTFIFLHGYDDDGDGWTSKCSPAIAAR